MSDLSNAIALSGAIDADMLRELTKWRLPGVALPADDFFSSPEEAIEAIEDAMTSANQVEVRVTDLDILKHYLKTRKDGKLHVVAEHGAKGTYPVVFGTIERTSHKDYIIPWRSDSIEELLTNGESYLIDDKKKVYFSSVSELYFGAQKAFIVLTPSKEAHGKRNADHQG